MTEEFNRRDFARIVGLGAISAGIAPAAEAIEPTPQTTKPAPVDKEILPHEHLLEVIVNQYPHENLTPEIRDRIAAELRGQMARGRLLRQYALGNGEAPFVFGAFRSAD